MSNKSKNIEMVDALIETLREHRESLTSLLVIGDTDSRQLIQLMANGVSRQELQSLMGAMELVKARIVEMLNNDEDRDDEMTESAEKAFNKLLSTLQQARDKKGDKNE